MYDDEYAEAWLKFASKDELREGQIVPYLQKEFSSLDKDSRVLDVGCGWGMALDILMEQGFEGSYVGIEPVTRFREHVQEKHPGHPILLGSLPDHLYILPRHYDIVLCSMALHCVRDLEASIAALKSKSRGRVIVIDFGDEAEALLREHFARIDEDRGDYIRGLYNLNDETQVVAESYLRREAALDALLPGRKTELEIFRAWDTDSTA